MLRYDTHADEGSMFNTPPCYSIYMMGLVLEHIKKMGGLEAMTKLNREKAKILYDFLDYEQVLQGDHREGRPLDHERAVRHYDSRTPRKPTRSTRSSFPKPRKRDSSTSPGTGSSAVMRASIYNYMPVEGVKALVDFMKKFEAATTPVARFEVLRAVRSGRLAG